MSLIYADTSVLARAYFSDEPEHQVLRSLLLMGAEPVVSSELSRLELTSAVMATVRARRLANPTPVLARFDSDCADDGPLTLLRLDADVVFPVAQTLVDQERLRTLDALHLAVALTDATALAAGDTVRFATRDRRQAEAARARGFQTV